MNTSNVVPASTATKSTAPASTAPTSTAPMNTANAWQTPFELGLLGAIWGASFMFMRIAAKDFGAAPLVFVRLALGALILLPFLWRERRAFSASLWPRLALIGAVNSAIPFTLFAWAAQHAPAGVGAITNSMAVLFVALIAFLFYGEKIGAHRALALIFGFIGVIVLASGKVEGASIGLPVAAGTAAAFLYGIGANLVKRNLAGLPATAVAAATLSCAALLTAPFAIAQWPEHGPVHAIPVRSWVAAVALGVVCTGIAFVTYYRLIARIGAPRAATSTYLVPLFGVGWAWLLLDEPLTLNMSVAGVLILGSVVLSQRSAK
jgi:drug/metabolite transporter (DMT)-like permease